MFKLFSTREIATLIWLVIFAFYSLRKQKIRKAVKNVIKAACTAKLVIPFIVLLVYAVVITLKLSKLEVWKWQYIKDIAIWFVFVGIPLCYNATTQQDENHYLRNSLLENFQLMVIVEFLISEYTFSLGIELIILPVITILTIAATYTANKDQYKVINVVCFRLLGIAGLVFFAFAIKMAIDAYREIGMTEAIIKLIIPIVFFILYTPMAYLLAVYAKYEMLFLRMSFKSPNNKTIIRAHKQKIFLACRLSYKRICCFHDNFLPRMYTRMSEDEFNSLIIAFRKQYPLPKD